MDNSEDSDLEDLIFRDVEEPFSDENYSKYIEDEVDGFMIASDRDESDSELLMPLTQRPSALNSSWISEKEKPIPRHLLVHIDEDDEFYSKQDSDIYFNFKHEEEDKEVKKVMHIGLLTNITELFERLNKFQLRVILTFFGSATHRMNNWKCSKSN